MSHIAELLKKNLVAINKADPETTKDQANKDLLVWIYEMNMMKEWFECFSTYTLYPDMDSRVADTNIGTMISISDVNKKRGSDLGEVLTTIFKNIDNNFNGLDKRINGWQQKPFALKRVTESQLGGPFVWDLFMMNYIAFLNTRFFVELNGRRLMKYHYNAFKRNNSDPKTRGRFTFGKEEVVPMKTFWDFEPVLPDINEDEQPYRLKTLAAMILTPRHNPYRFNQDGDSTLVACRFNIEQTKKKNKKITTIEKAPEPDPVDPDKLIEEVTEKWKEVAKDRKMRMISQLDETVNVFNDIFDEKKVKKMFIKPTDPRIDNCKLLRNRLLKRLEQNKNYMMKDFNVDDPVLYHDELSDDDKASDTENDDANNAVESGSEKSEEENSENRGDSNYSSEEELPVTRKRKKNKKKNETPTRPPKRLRKNQTNQKSPNRKQSKQG